MTLLGWLLPLTAVVAWVLTGLLVRLVPRIGVVDLPGPRSSHTTPTPRGGGAAIVTAALGAIVLLDQYMSIDRGLLIGYVGGALLIALVGFVDDWRSLSPWRRLVVQMVAVGWSLFWMNGVAPIQVGDATITLGWPALVVVALAMTWVVNLFNFMDGIDGIAAAEATFVCGSGALLLLFAIPSSQTASLGLIVAAASVGFLGWNWSPARIFMGDGGSGFLGLTIAFLGLAAMRELSVAVFAWLILGGAFFVDATVTLVRRLLRGESAHEPHRTHAYQWLARRFRSHRVVTLGFMVMNVGWLLPMAWWTVYSPERAPLIVAVALLPLVAIALLAGAGRCEGR